MLFKYDGDNGKKTAQNRQKNEKKTTQPNNPTKALKFPTKKMRKKQPNQRPNQRPNQSK